MTNGTLRDDNYAGSLHYVEYASRRRACLKMNSGLFWFMPARALPDADLKPGGRD